MIKIRNGQRVPLTERQMAALIEGLAERVLAECGPMDALLAGGGLFKVLGELVRRNVGDDEAAQMVVEATEAVRSLQMHFPSDDEDPFSIPN